LFFKNKYNFRISIFLYFIFTYFYDLQNPKKTPLSMKDRHSGFFSAAITKEQSKDSGMAIVLILLIIGLFTKDLIWFKIATGVLLMDMIFPMFYYPFAIFWFGLSGLMGSIVSKALLLVIYLIVVLPVALWRRLLRKDPLLLKEFKRNNESVMKSRNHVSEAADLEKPF